MNHLDVIDLRCGHTESQHRSFGMPSLMTAGAGVHVQETRCGIANDFQNVRVAGDEQSGLTPRDFSGDTGLILAGVPADVGHENANALTFPFQIERQIGAQFRAVHIAVNPSHGFESVQPVENLARTEVTRMPDFIALSEMLEYGLVEKSVSVGKKSDPH